MVKLYPLFTILILGLALVMTVMMILHPVLFLIFVPIAIVVGALCIHGAVTEEELMRQKHGKKDVC